MSCSSKKLFNVTPREYRIISISLGWNNAPHEIHILMNHLRRSWANTPAGWWCLPRGFSNYITSALFYCWQLPLASQAATRTFKIHSTLSKTLNYSRPSLINSNWRSSLSSPLPQAQSWLWVPRWRKDKCLGIAMIVLLPYVAIPLQYVLLRDQSIEWLTQLFPKCMNQGRTLPNCDEKDR